MASPLTIEPYAQDEPMIAAVAADGRTRVRVAPCDTTAVVLGRGGDPERELHMENCQADGVAVLRRRGGGCAVVLDPGNVVVSIVRPVSGLGGISAHFAWLSGWLATELAAAGIAGVERRGVSDLTISERKIGGACIYRRKDLLYYSTTLLVSPQLELIERYLAHPPREPDYRRGRPHRDFLGLLGESAAGWTPATLTAALAPRLTPQRLERHPRP